MILIFLFPILGHCFSWATSFSLNELNYQDTQLYIPQSNDPLILYTIRDLETTGQFQWNITHSKQKNNQTHDKIVFHVTKWPSQLKFITYDVLITEKNQNFRAYQFNVTQYQTHIPYQELDYKYQYSIVLYPIGFSKSTLTMGFMWMPIHLQHIFVIHYMDHKMGTQINNQNFGDNWVNFCLVFIKKEYYNSLLKTSTTNQYGQIKKKTNVPYFIGLQKIHSPSAHIQIKQSASRIAYISQNAEAIAIPLQINKLLDTRSYVFKEKISLLAKAVYLVITIIALGLIFCFYTNNKGKLHEIWPVIDIKGTNTQINKHQDLVETA